MYIETTNKFKKVRKEVIKWVEDLNLEKRTALDGKTCWCVFDTKENKFVICAYFKEYRRKIDCQNAIDKFNSSELSKVLKI